jgi:predicted O-linked N-acetylglucosamine transferase (SPINDLY family)
MKDRPRKITNNKLTHSINTLGALFNHGRYAEGAVLARELTVRFPQNGFVWKALGVMLMLQGRKAEALEPMRKAAELLPGDAEAHSNLGNAFREQGRLAEAEAGYRRALSIKPDYAGVHSDLGNVLKEQGRLAEAEASYRRALSIKPDYADAHGNLGVILHDLGRLSEAEASYRQALSLKPEYAEAHSNLGNALKDLGRLAEAEASYRRALSIKPDYAEAHSNLGVTLWEQGRLSEAEASYHRALSIKPEYAEAHSNLGVTLWEQGRLAEAEASYRRALSLKPDALENAIGVHLLLPIISESSEAGTVWRERYHAGIEALINTPGSLEDPAKNVTTHAYYLSYHNQNDRPMMEALCRLFRALAAGLTASSPHLPHWQPPETSGRRIRVGFLSQFLVTHTIGKLYQGFIRHMDRSTFEVVVIHAPKAKRDLFSQDLDGLAETVIMLPPGLQCQQRAVAAEKLDVLFYPDIGMAPSAYFLSYARLAPVQAVSWGHPDTTGLDTMDYFVSAASIEPENAEEHYTETLIRLNRMPCVYQPLIAPTRIPTRAALGLPETGTLYGCPQSLFKFHPDFDAVLAAIAEGDPAGHIVLLEGAQPAWTNLLKARWAKAFPVLLDRVRFLPRMPMEHFMALMAHIDVLLDPIHFGSGNTLYEAMVYGTPLVTWPGRFMRGRIVAGAYRQMGIADAPIAPRLEDYAPLALALGRDPERRRALRHASLEAAGRELFADMRALREFEAFIIAAVAAAGRGERLPAHWKPNMQVSQDQQGTSA